MEEKSPGGLLRKLGLSDAVVIGIGAIIGGGIYTLIGFAAGLAGPSLPLVMVLNGFIAFLTILPSAELASMLPDAGGGYLWIRKGLGSLSGHMSGWVSWFAHSVACGVYALSFSFYLIFLLADIIFPLFGFSFPENRFFWRAISTVIIILLMSWVNFRGVSGFGKFTKLIVGLEVTVIVVFIFFGLASIFYRSSGSTVNLGQLLPNGFAGLLSAMGLMYLAFQGSEIIAQSSEEIKNPRKNIPKAMFISFGIIMTLYILVALVAILGIKDSLAGWQIMANAGEGALVEGAKYFIFGRLLFPVVIFGGLLAALAALNTTIFSSSHVFYAMGQQKSLPPWMAKPHPKYKTPHIGIAASALLIILMTVILPLKDVAAIADMMFIFLFGLVHLSLIELRKKNPDAPRYFKVPLHPLPSLLALAAYGILIRYLAQLSPWGVTISLLWIFVGFIIYVRYAEPKEVEEIESELVASKEMDFDYAPEYKVLLPILPGLDWKEILPLVAAIAKEKKTKVWVMNILEFPASIPMHVSSSQRKRIDELQETVSGELKRQEISHRVFSQKSRSISQTILDIVRQQNSDLLILPREYLPYSLRGFFGETFNKVLRETSCDLLIVKMGRDASCQKILLPLSRNPHNLILGSIVKSFLNFFGSSVTVVHVITPGSSEEEKKNELEKLISELKLDGEFGERFSLKTPVQENIVQLILAESRDHDLILMAGAQETTFGQITLGSTAEGVMRGTEKTVIVCYHHQAMLEPVVSLFWKLLKKFRRTKS